MAIQQYGVPEVAAAQIFTGPLSQNTAFSAGNYKVTTQVSAKVNGEDVVPGGIVKNFSGGITSIFANSPDLTSEVSVPSGLRDLFVADDGTVYYVRAESPTRPFVNVSKRNPDGTISSVFTVNTQDDGGQGVSSPTGSSDAGAFAAVRSEYTPGNGTRNQTYAVGGVTKTGLTDSFSSNGSESVGNTANSNTALLYTIQGNKYRREFNVGTTTISAPYGYFRYRGDTFFDLGDSGTMAYSTDDGQTFTNVTVPFNGTSHINIGHANGVYFFIPGNGDNDTIFYSTDRGATWTSVDLSAEILAALPERTPNELRTTGTGNPISYVNSTYIYPLDGFYLYSTDLSTWQVVVNENIENYSKVFEVGGLYYMFGSANGYGWSQDLVNWTFVSNNTPSTGLTGTVGVNRVGVYNNVFYGAVGTSSTFSLDTLSGKSWIEVRPI